ncbi:hypothetical protein [Acetobacter vaccinii]|uniref:Uncharacterized protein n=1 Tax=Acetobacter vaccinii TaxID=2592655 RepID=A0A5C1YQJ4_9PROT|nr:hypothetical protein [Acetobacter vaccinii]QEO17855.1 hypothetical protein FLP30_09010 [Acetobacter vaccinii]
MALMEITVTCPHEGADKGKRFVITRMSAVEADKWGRHCLQAAAASGAAIPGMEPGAGLAGVAAAGIGIFASMSPERMDGLIDRLMQCVQMQPDPGNPAILLNWQMAQTQIEEIPTIGWLQTEAFRLHVDFFRGVGQLFSLITLMLGMESNAPAPASAT